MAKPDRGNGLLCFVYGAAGYLAMTKLLPVILSVPVAAWPTPHKGRFSVGDCVFMRLDMSGTLAWPTV